MATYGISIPGPPGTNPSRSLSAKIGVFANTVTWPFFGIGHRCQASRLADQKTAGFTRDLLNYCGPICVDSPFLNPRRIGNSVSGEMVRTKLSRFDAGDAAMLTFLLDKQDRLQRWQSGHSGPVAEPRMSLQANCRSNTDQRSRQTPIPAQSMSPHMESADLSCVARHTNCKFGTTSARKSHVQSSMFKKRQFTDSRHVRTLRFAHCVRSRTAWSSLARKPCRSHTS